MGINIGNTKIKELYVGNTKIKEAYVGNVKVYGNEDALKRYIKFSYNGTVCNIAGYRMKYEYVDINYFTDHVTTEYNPSSGWISPDPFIEGTEDKPKLLISLAKMGTGTINKNILINPGEIDHYAEYSYDGVNWNWYQHLSINALPLSFGQELYFRSYHPLFSENVKFLIQEGEIDTTTIYTKKDTKGNDVQCYKVTGYEYNPVSSKTITKNLIEISGNLQGIVRYNDTDKNYEILGDLGGYTADSFFTYCGDYLYKSDKLVFPWNDISNNQRIFQYMFNGCNNLYTAPKLQATILSPLCYIGMFQNCTSLTTAPDLPATTLAAECYESMFQYCTSLTKAPNLPATTLVNYCYYSMFRGCTSLTTAPDLSSTTLANSCYNRMFYDCTSLIKAPDLPATTLVSTCYNAMFQNCTNLSGIKLSYTGNFGDAYFANWVYNVAPSGTLFYEGADTAVGPNAIPVGWVVSNPNKYLKFTSIQDNSSIGYSIVGSITKDIYISEDALTWTSWDGGAISLNNGEYRYIWNKSNTLSLNYSNYFNFIMSGKIEASGNCNSMINFSVLRVNCYYSMFQGCTSLTTAPDLPATTLALYCYFSMFQGCTSLTKAPDLPATTLATYCYESMFSGCTSLTKAPDLPATTLADECYMQMFQGCTSLTKAPDLPATTLAENCYNYMFQGCTNLSSIKLNYTGNFNSTYFNNWVSNVAQSGNFYYNGSDTTHGTSAIPTNWNIKPFYDINQITIDPEKGFIHIINSSVKSVTINYTTRKVSSSGSSMGYSIQGITNEGTIVLQEEDIAIGEYTTIIPTEGQDLNKIIFAPYGRPLTTAWRNITINITDNKLYFKGAWYTTGNIFEIYFNSIQFNY